MRSTHRAHVSRGTAPRRKLVWCTAGVQTFSVPAATSHSVDLLANFELAGASTLGITIMRTHLKMAFTETAQLEYWQIGLIIGRDNDIGTVNPNVNAEPELDWMLNTVEFNRWSAATLDTAFQVDYDLRSKRKMDEMAQRYVLNFYNSGAAAHNVQWFARTLVALP